MQKLPLISVVVPVYKVEAYLDRCVRSITEQTYPDLEILLVDDGSPDRSGALCDAWAEKDSRVKVIHKENGGGGSARNAALDAAQGELIAFVDSDDYIAPDMFSHLYSLLETGADIAECGYLETFGDETSFPAESGAVREYTPEEAMFCHIQDTVFRQLIWNKLYRRETVGAVRFPEGTKIDDEFFTYQVLANAKKLVCSDKVCYAYRQQPGSVMHQKYSLRRLEGLEAKRQRLEHLKVHMPALAEEAARDLYFSSMYALQMSMLHLKEEEVAQARRVVGEMTAAAGPMKPRKHYKPLENISILLARVSYEGTCALRNFFFEREEWVKKEK